MISKDIKKGPSKMAEVVALIRAEESEKPADGRICYDPYAVHFVSPEMREFMACHPEKYKAQREQVERSLPGYSNSIVARVRYFDDIIKLSAQDGLEQLVIMGAGYDTRAYRIEELKNVHVFEIDHPDTIKVKKDKINEIFGFFFLLMLLMCLRILKLKSLNNGWQRAVMTKQRKHCLQWKG